MSLMVILYYIASLFSLLNADKIITQSPIISSKAILTQIEILLYKFNAAITAKIPMV